MSKYDWFQTGTLRSEDEEPPERRGDELLTGWGSEQELPPPRPPRRKKKKAKKATPSPSRPPRDVDKTARRIAAGALLISTAAVWLWTDIPQGYSGFEQIVGVVNRITGHPFQASQEVMWLLFAFLTLITNSGQFVLTAYWDWFAEGGWGRWLTVALPFVAFWVIPTTAIDVGVSGAGFYTYFVPLETTTVTITGATGATLEAAVFDPSSLHVFWVVVSLVESFFASFVGQWVVTYIVLRALRGAWE